ncbi:MAG: hypothetical protein JRD03_04555 [Deltaproteobacteria bacterium]|nr:hypothetical protein [Deltaproteobacteria bacterium]
MLAVVLASLVIAYPYLLMGALPRFGVSRISVALFFIVVLSIVIRSRIPAAPLQWSAAPSVGIPVLLAAAVFSGDALYLQLVPSVVYLTLASWFYASFRSGDSIIERVARYMVPEAPDFIRSYCRKVTGLWAIFFAASSFVIACLAISGTPSKWAFFSGKLIYALMIAASLVEFLVRKTWFRYYFHGGWFDRVWQRLFPPENTPEGRRSMQHISDYWRQHNG